MEISRSAQVNQQLIQPVLPVNKVNPIIGDNMTKDLNQQLLAHKEEQAQARKLQKNANRKYQDNKETTALNTPSLLNDFPYQLKNQASGQALYAKVDFTAKKNCPTMLVASIDLAGALNATKIKIKDIRLNQTTLAALFALIAYQEPGDKPAYGAGCLRINEAMTIIDVQRKLDFTTILTE